MASQAPGFPATEFTISTPFRHVRLMEVPDEVLDIITSSRKDGTTPRLAFKSSPPPSDTKQLTGNFSAAKSKDSVLHLCSEDKIWAIKQVSTSNSVYILQPSANDRSREATSHNGHVSGEDNGDSVMTDESEIAQMARGTISAIAQVGNFLELQPIKINEEEIKQMVLQLLPIYDPLDTTDHGYLQHSEVKESVLPETLENDIPAPAAIIRRICSELCMIRRPSDSGCCVPSPAALFQTWSNIMEGCSIDFVALDQVIDVDRIVNVLTEPVDRSIAQSMLVRGGMFDELHLIHTTSSSAENGEPSRTLMPLETSLFIAILVIKAKSQSPSSARQTNVATFIEEWSSLVPNSFVKYCTIENLTIRNLVSTSIGSDNGEMMTWPEELITSDFILDRSSIERTSVASTNDSSVKSTAMGKRKWHEKFAAQRAAKK